MSMHRSRRSSRQLPRCSLHGLLGYFVAAPQRRGLHTRVHESSLLDVQSGDFLQLRGPSPSAQHGHPRGFLMAHRPRKAQSRDRHGVDPPCTRAGRGGAQARHTLADRAPGVPWHSPTRHSCFHLGNDGSDGLAIPRPGTALPRATSQALHVRQVSSGFDWFRRVRLHHGSHGGLPAWHVCSACEPGRPHLSSVILVVTYTGGECPACNEYEPEKNGLGS